MKRRHAPILFVCALSFSLLARATGVVSPCDDASLSAVLVGGGLVGLIAGLVFGGSVLGLNFLPAGVTAMLIVVGAIAAFGYVLHARRTPAPILDLSLLKIPTLRAAVLGGFVYDVDTGLLSDEVTA